MLRSSASYCSGSAIRANTNRPKAKVQRTTIPVVVGRGGRADQPEIDLADCAEERFVSLTEGFVTYSRFVDAFRVAGFKPNVVMTIGDISSLMNPVGGGIGCTLLPGRIRPVLPREVSSARRVTIGAYRMGRL